MSKNIVLGVSGSISAYKAADLCSQLGKLGYTIHVVMTENATKFITPLALQALTKHPVCIDVMGEKDPEHISHIALAKQADLFLIAPATANIIGKIASGIADDMLSTTAVAFQTSVPKLIAPAMNTYMYQNPITQRNLNLLKEVAGYEEILPREAMLACGDFGRGALATVEEIVQAVEHKLNH